MREKRLRWQYKHEAQAIQRRLKSSHTALFYAPLFDDVLLVAKRPQDVAQGANPGKFAPKLPSREATAENKLENAQHQNLRFVLGRSLQDSREDTTGNVKPEARRFETLRRQLFVSRSPTNE